MKIGIFFDKGITVHEIAFGNFLTSKNINTQKIPAMVGKQLAQLVSAKKINTPKTTVILLEDIPIWLKKNKIWRSLRQSCRTDKIAFVFF